MVAVVHTRQRGFGRWLPRWLGLFVCLGWSAGVSVEGGERPMPLDGQFLRDYAETRGFRHGRPTAFQITPDGREVVFLRSGPRSGRQRLYVLEVESGRTRECFAPGQGGAVSESISPEEQARRERMRVSVGGFTSFEMSADGRWILAPLGDRLYWIDRATGAAEELHTRGAAFDPKLSPDGRHVGFVRDHDVWVYDRERGRERQLTEGGTALVSHGEAEFVAAEEMGRFTGWWWSPDGRSVLYQETDAREVEVWHVADPGFPERAPRAQFYPRPGKANVKVRLGIMATRGGRTTWVKWDSEKYPYFARADWHEAGGLTIAVQTRDQRELVLLRVDTRTGQTQPLVVEQDPAWVNLDEEMPRWLKDGRGFLWTSERHGGWELELRRANGALEQVIVEQQEGYQRLVHLDDAAGEVVVAASRDPSQTHLYRARLAGGALKPMTDGIGVHGGAFGKAGQVWVHTVATPEAMPVSWVRWHGQERRIEIPSVAEEPGVTALAESAWLEPESEGEGEGEGGDGDARRERFQWEMIRPRDFDPARRYPVLVDVYGGPHVNVVQATLGSRLLAQWLADQGFVVVSADNRGTPRRGREWERSIEGRFGDVALADQVACLKELGARYPELDLERVGIVGWSFGGYMSALGVMRRPDVFRAAVAGAPVTDWMDYDTHYTERYLGVPGPGDTIYARNSLIEDAERLERPLLMIHGTGDDNVFFRHSLKLASALFRAGRRFEMLPLPGLTHMVPDPVVAERQWTWTASFFREHLGTAIPEGLRGPNGGERPAR